MPDPHDKLSLLREIESSTLPIEIKADMLKDFSSVAFPEESEIRQRLRASWTPNVPSEHLIGDLIKAMTLLMPLYSPVDQQDWKRDIETEVRLSLNEKFTKSPLFLAVSTMLAICLTLFGFGLFHLNQDVKSADELVNKMQQQVTSDAIAMDTTQANAVAAINKSSGEFDEHLKTAEARITDAEKNVDASIDAKFKAELDEVHRTEDDTVKSINAAGSQANASIKDTQNSLVRQLDEDTAARLSALEKAKDDNLTKINSRGTELYYHLQTPTWKDLALAGMRINWMLWMVSMVGALSGLSALFLWLRKS